jgi:hypothetical protein
MKPVSRSGERGTLARSLSLRGARALYGGMYRDVPLMSYTCVYTCALKGVYLFRLHMAWLSPSTSRPWTLALGLDSAGYIRICYVPINSIL